MIKLVIFDFDDTLTDDNYLDYQAFLVPCTKLGLSSPTLQTITKYRKKGFIAKKIISKFLKPNNRKLYLNKFLEYRKKFLNSKNSLQYLKIKKNTKELLEFLKNQKIKCVICTARKKKKNIAYFLKLNKLNKNFSKIYQMEDLGIELDNLKKSNRIAIKNKLIKKIIKNEKLTTREIIFVGNSIEDLKIANNTKITFIYFQNSYLEKFSNSRIMKAKTMNDLRKKLNIYVKSNNSNQMI